ncbi:MAG: hypothetical protein JNM65_09735 [Verrucomicrobiaceae bacterium]|nr:hypothetical protein [Verrucomicrobiaceae bacterium]
MNCESTRHAVRRNHFIATVAKELWFAHIKPGGRMEALQRDSRKQLQ